MSRPLRPQYDYVRVINLGPFQHLRQGIVKADQLFLILRATMGWGYGLHVAGCEKTDARVCIVLIKPARPEKTVG